MTEHTAASAAVLSLPGLSAWLPAYRGFGLGAGQLTSIPKLPNNPTSQPAASQPAGAPKAFHPRMPG